MDDEQKQLKALDRAAKAEGLINNDLLKDAFAEIDAALVERWRGTEDPLARDALWQAAQINKQVQSILKKHIQSGKVAKAALDKLSNVVGMDRPVKYAT
jgi:hypothetical protein